MLAAKRFFRSLLLAVVMLDASRAVLTRTHVAVLGGVGLVKVRRHHSCSSEGSKRLIAFRDGSAGWKS